MKELKTKTKGIVKMLWSSDQHLLHPNTPTIHILSNLSEFYFNAFDLKDIDILVLGGDFFDHLVDASDANLRQAEYWIKHFLQKCLESNVMVRVLEGTSSHDREQPEMFELLKPEGLDLRWVKTLSVEYFKTLGFNALYVPDNMGTKSPDEIWEDTLAVLSKDGLTKVDFIFFHGAFRYQLPAHLNHNSHDEIKWMSITDQLIFAGHVHKPSEYKKIRVSGSFDRIRHGEEHPKGGYYVEFNVEEKVTKAKFWENKKALPYVTLKVTKNDDEASVTDKLMDLLQHSQLPMHSQVRVSGGVGTVVNPIVEYFNSEFPLITFKGDNLKTDQQLVDSELYSEKTYEGINLHEENVTHALMQHLLDEKTIEEDQVEGLSLLLKEFL